MSRFPEPPNSRSPTWNVTVILSSLCNSSWKHSLVCALSWMLCAKEAPIRPAKAASTLNRIMSCIRWECRGCKDVTRGGSWNSVVKERMLSCCCVGSRTIHAIKKCPLSIQFNSAIYPWHPALPAIVLEICDLILSFTFHFHPPTILDLDHDCSSLLQLEIRVLLGHKTRQRTAIQSLLLPFGTKSAVGDVQVPRMGAWYV